MRYVVRWNNGFWKLFDTEKFQDVAKHNRQKDAQDAIPATK